MSDQRPLDDGPPPTAPPAQSTRATGDDGPRLPRPRHAAGTATRRLTALTSSARGGAHRERAHGPGRIRLLWFLPAVVVVAVTVAVVVLVARPGATGTPAGTEGRRAAEAVWSQVGQWAAAELPAGEALLVPDDLLADASAAGVDDERLRPLGGDVPGARLLVTSQEPPAGSAVLARFDAPDGGALAVVDPEPGRPTPEELARRQRLAAAILANPTTHATGRAAAILRSAAVDARLLGLLAGLVTQLGVGIADFPPAAGEPADGVLARAVLLDRLGGEPLAGDEAGRERLLTYLEAQLPPFAAHRVEVTAEGVLVAFHYESAPDAVVTEQAP